jgi:hypothetical protein
MIEEHLSTCQECNEILDQMRSSSMEKENSLSLEIKKSNVLKNIKKRIFRKKVLTAVIAVTCTIAVVFGLYSAAALIKKPIEYKNGLVRVELSDEGVIDAFYQGSNYACVYGMEKVVSIDGQKKNVAYIYYSESFLSKHLERKHTPGTLQFSIGERVVGDKGKNDDEIVVDGAIDAVYYLIGDYIKLITMNEEEFSRYAEDAILLWER